MSGSSAGRIEGTCQRASARAVVPDVAAAVSEFSSVSLSSRRLDAADGELLAVGQRRHRRAARHRADADDGVDVGEGAASEPHETPRIEARLERVQAMRNGVALARERGQVQQLALGDDRGDLSYRHDDEHVVAAADRNALEPRRRPPPS